jgi:two-component system, OmpR family, sensor kinase
MGRLFWKLFFAFWMALLAAGIGVGSAVWLHKQAHAGSDQALAAGPPAALVVRSAAATLRYGGVAALRDLLGDWIRHGHGHLYAVDAAGRDLFGRPVPAPALAEARRLAGSAGGSPIAQGVALPGGVSYLLFIPNETLPLKLRLMEQRSPPPPGVTVAIGILVSLGFSALLAWYLSRPIRYLRWAFAAVSRGRLETRVTAMMGRRRDEIADLGRDFDRMAQQLQQLILSQQRLLHDVSHELRSPLARLQAAIGLARQDPRKTEASLDRIERETTRLDELVGEVLTLSRLEAGTGAGRRERLDLVELVAAVADDARYEAQAHGRDVGFAGTGEMLAEVHGHLLHQAFENVIRNGVKFTGEGTAVEVEVARAASGGAMTVTVADRGPGVPERELESIFEPFYRGEHGDRADGFGLGLAIARRAVEAHGGRVRARNREGGGLVVEIALPVDGAAAAS